MNRQCANTRCGKDFEVPAKAPRKKYCNAACSTDAQRAVFEFEDKDCQFCGKKLERKIMGSGRLEAPANFARRKSCNPDCANKSKVRYRDWELAEELDFLLGTDTPVAIANRLGYEKIDSLFNRLRENGQFDYLERVQRLHNEYLEAAI